MAFLFGIVVGLIVGLALIVGFVRSENARSKRRSELAATIAAFARMTVEDSRMLLGPEQYPSWVVFSQQQKLTWLNLQLEKIWPFINEAASDLIKANVEPILEQYRPALLASLTFSKFTLGTVAPQFTGVQLIEDGSEGITMELEMQWDGNPSIILDIKTYLGVALPVQVKNIGFTGVFRLIFRPLVDEIPCFGAVCFSLRKKNDGKCLADLCGALHCDFMMASTPRKKKCNPAAASKNRHLCESLADSCFPVKQGPSAARLHELFLRQFCDAHTCSGRKKPFPKGGKKSTSIFYMAASILILLLLPIFYVLVYLYQRQMHKGTQELKRIPKPGRKTKPS